MSCLEKNANSGFHCTGYDGSHIWKDVHELPKKIDCEECSEHATFEFKGLHDHINLGLGKKPFDKTNYHKWVHEIVEVHRTCTKDGRC